MNENYKDYSYKSGDEIIDLSWEIYFSLETTLPLDHYGEMKNIFSYIQILEELCKNGFVTDKERIRILNEFYRIKNHCLDYLHLKEIEHSLQNIITSLKLTNVKSKIIIVLDQVGNTFYSHSTEEKQQYDNKIKPIKEMVQGSINSQDLQKILHLINRVDKLYSESVPENMLPKEQILSIIESIPA